MYMKTTSIPQLKELIDDEAMKNPTPERNLKNPQQHVIQILQPEIIRNVQELE